MKRTPEEKFVTLYQTAKKCLLIADRLFSDLENATNKISSYRIGEKVAIEKIDTKDIIQAYIAAHGLIDYFHRFNQIILAMPLLNKQDHEVKELGKATKPAKDCRNYLQHMRNGLSKDDPIEYPVLGAISWIYEDRNYILLPSQPTTSFGAPGIAYDTLKKEYVHRFLLVIGGFEVRLDVIYMQIKTFWDWLDKRCEISPGDIKKYVWDRPKILCARFFYSGQ